MADGLCTSCQGLLRTIDRWKKRDEQDRHRADAAEAEVERLRADVAAKDAELEQFYRETLAQHMGRVGWTDREIGAAMDARGASR